MTFKDLLSKPEYLCRALDQTPLSTLREKERPPMTFAELALRGIFAKARYQRASWTHEFSDFASRFVQYSQRNCHGEGEEYHNNRVSKIAYLVLSNLGSKLAQLENRTDTIHFWLSNAHEPAEVETLLALGAHPNVLSGNTSRSCLHLSALNYNIRTLQLLSKSALFDPNLGSHTGETALFIAVHAYGREAPEINVDDQIRWIKAILEDERTNPNCVTPSDKLTPLHLAAKLKHPDVLKLLLNDERILPNLQSEPGLYTALHFAAVNDLGVSVKALALHPQTDLELKNLKGETPLGLAIHKNKSNAVRALVQSNAQITFSHVLCAKSHCPKEFAMLLRTFVQRCTRKPYF